MVVTAVDSTGQWTYTLANGTDGVASAVQSLKAGESAVDIHGRWGQPDIVLDRGGEAEVWSYAERPNSDDIAASIFYSGVKEGDKGTFVDLRMVNGKLQSWSEAEHRMPAKRGADFGYTLGPSANTTHF